MLSYFDLFHIYKLHSDLFLHFWYWLLIICPLCLSLFFLDQSNQDLSILLIFPKSHLLVFLIFLKHVCFLFYSLLLYILIIFILPSFLHLIHFVNLFFRWMLSSLIFKFSSFLIYVFHSIYFPNYCFTCIPQVFICLIFITIVFKIFLVSLLIYFLRNELFRSSILNFQIIWILWNYILIFICSLGFIDLT